MGTVQKNRKIKKSEKKKVNIMTGSVINDDLKKYQEHPVILKKIENAKRVLGKAS